MDWGFGLDFWDWLEFLVWLGFWRLSWIYWDWLGFLD